MISLSSISQIEVEKHKPVFPNKVIKNPCDFGSVESLSEVKEGLKPIFRRHKIAQNKFRRHNYVNMNPKPSKKDLVLQFGYKNSIPLTPLKLWLGINESDCWSNGYSDFTNQSTALDRGGAYELIVKNEESNHQLSLWIDFNENKVFETNELILKNELYSYTGNFIVVIPDDSPLGEHLMQVRTIWDESSSDPCSSMGFGETEDYKVVIVAPYYVVGIDNLKFEILNESNAIRVISSTIQEDKINLELINGLGQILFKKQFLKGNQLDDLISISDFTSGIYYVKISSNEKSSVKQFFVR